MLRIHQMLTSSVRLLLLMLLAVALTVPAAAEPQRVTNGPTPRDGVHQLDLEEIWRHGGEDDDEVLFGLVSSVVTGADGNLYVLDSQLAQVNVFSPDGELIDTLGRQGTGPGEFQAPNQMAMLPGGGLGVSQVFPGRLVCINLDGTPLSEITVSDPTAGGFPLVMNVRSGGETLVLGGMINAYDQATNKVDQHYFVRSFGTDGVLNHEFFSKDLVMDFNSQYHLEESNHDFVWWRLAVTPDGRVVAGIPRNTYEISVFTADGTKEMVFGREYESLERTVEQSERVEAIMATQMRQMPPGSTSEIAKTEQDLYGIHCQRNGEFWVTTSRAMYSPPAGVFTQWDVFDAQGQFDRQVQTTIPGRPGHDLLMLTEHGYAVKITGFWDAALSAMGAASDEDAEAMEIVCYKINN